ncbi:MAG: hypothetical protein CMG69_05020 [Candidatus Marinimicrobia bacterium]|nr:hypothetical protein [Candidatus Neomarinimicrobiota bacterium]|tara:strand:+ start:143 stop:445 length:303 start_codon:yes stop_codon:yes gene_type:complete
MNLKEKYMNIKSISFNDIESKTKNIYEAVVVISQRARQVLRDRLVERAMRENTEEELGVLDELPINDNYEILEKPSSVAVQEFLDGQLSWSNTKEIEMDN